MGGSIAWPSAASGEQAYSVACGPFLHLQIQPRPFEPSHHITLTSFHSHTSFWIFSLPLLRTAGTTLSPPRKSSIIPIQGHRSATLVPSAVLISNFSHNLINDLFQGIRTWTCLRGHYPAYHIRFSTDRETILRCNYIIGWWDSGWIFLFYFPNLLDCCITFVIFCRQKNGSWWGQKKKDLLSVSLTDARLVH